MTAENDARYTVRHRGESDERFAGWWEVYDTVKPSVPAYAAGRRIYTGTDRARAQADADWLNAHA